MKPITINELRDLGKVLADLVASESSVYLQVVRQTGPFFGIGLLEGMIVYMQCGAAEGRDVVPMLSQLKAGDRILFWPPRPNHVSSNLPEMREVFRMLNTDLPALAAAVPQGLGASLAPAPKAVPSGDKGMGMGTDKDRYLTTLLPLVLQYFGPIGELLLDEAMSAFPRWLTPMDSSEIIKILAKNLRDPVRSKEFVAAALVRTKPLF